MEMFKREKEKHNCKGAKPPEIRQKNSLFDVPVKEKDRRRRRPVTTSSQPCKKQRKRNTTRGNTSSEMSDTHAPHDENETI